MRWKRPRVVLVGDVAGGATSHVGDEAMIEADLGQTLGPALTPADAECVTELLDRAVFVGLRDDASVGVASALGIGGSKVVEQLDDAWTTEASVPAAIAHVSDRPLIAVTLHPDPRLVAQPAIRALADQLAELTRATGTELLLVPHLPATAARESNP